MRRSWSVKPTFRVYIETTVVSYLTGRLSRDLRVAARQEITAEWWARDRERYECFASQLVLDEAGEGDELAAARRLAELKDVTALALTGDALGLAQALVDGGAVPREAGEDAMHIAVAAVNGMHYLLTWNCRHIANANLRNRINDICASAGYDPPVICTPEELLGE